MSSCHRVGTPSHGAHARLTAVALALATLLAACAAPAPRADLRQSVTQSVHPVSADNDLPLLLIGAELALQKNDLAAAAQGYGKAAMMSPDPSIAEQATRLALAVKQWPLAQTALARWQELAPTAPGIVQAKAWIAVAESDEERAFDELDALIRRSSENNWRPVAQVLVGAQDKAFALRLLNRLATPERLGAIESNWIAMSQLAVKLADKTLAERLSAAAVEKFKSGDVYAWSAQLALDRGDKVGAREQYAQAIKRDPTSLRLRSGYAGLLGDSGDNAGAARVLAAGAQSDITFAARAAYASRAEDKTLLSGLYREIQADSAERSGKRLLLLGQVAEILERPAEALDWYREVPDDDERWLDAGIRMIVLTDQRGDTPAALARLNTMRVIVGGDAREAGDLYLLEASLLTRKERKSEALAVYSRGLEQISDDSRLLYARAMLSIDLDDLAGAERDLTHIITVEPENADALNALGYTLADRTSRAAEAIVLIEKALKLKPDEAAILDSHGWVQYRLGRLAEAAEQLRRAYAKSPDAEIAAHLGEVLWIKGERAEAKRIWEQGRKKDPANKVLLEAMQRLAS